METTPQTATPTRLIGESEAAAYLGVSKGFLQKARMDGPRQNRTPGPPFIKLMGWAIRYDLADLDEWIRGNKRTHTAVNTAPRGAA